MEITKTILTKNPCYKAGKTIRVKGLMLHSVGCSQPSAMAFIKSWNSPSANVCVHGFVDANTGKVYQTLPWNHRGWHCGGTANGTHIGIEMCEPDCIKYSSGAKFTCSDKEKARAMVERAYKSAVELFAHLCNEYKLNPLTEGVILAHNEGYAKGLASNHADPEHLWKGLKLPYTMDGFRQDVKAAMNPTIYRVQVGAFSNEQNAKNLLVKLKQAGFEGFIQKTK
jgi:N-acetyl-anhydromuramyl-L-alanine amidase AmpD